MHFLILKISKFLGRNFLAPLVFTIHFFFWENFWGSLLLIIVVFAPYFSALINPRIVMYAHIMRNVPHMIITTPIGI